MLRSPLHGWASPYRPGDGKWWLQCATAMSQNQDQHCGTSKRWKFFSVTFLSGQATFIEHHREPWSKDNKPWFFATFPVNAVNRWRRPWRESSQQVTRTKVLSNPIRISSLLDLLVGGHWKKISLREIVTKQASGQSVLIWNSQAIDKLKRNTLPEWKQHKTYVLWLVPILIKPSASGSFGAPKQKASKSSALFQPDGIPLPLEGMMS